MEIEKIKDLWNNETISETPDVSMEQQKEIRLPLEKIRKNMRMEFWFTILTFIPMIILIALLVNDLKLKVYTLTMLVVIGLVATFYFMKFFKLYKELSDKNLNTKDSLKDLMHQFELNKQYYVSYYLAFAPFLVCEMLVLTEFSEQYADVTSGEFHKIIKFILGTVFGLFFLWAVGKWWFQNYYGKYIDEVRKTLKFLE